MILAYKNSKIHYTITGNGPTLVLLHGFLETVDMWNDIVSDFSEHHQVLCIDLLGHGKTDCIGYVHTMEDMADAVFSVLEHQQINNAHFIGHSMGGYVTLALAKKYPHLFKSLCLMNSTFEADDDERKALRARANKMIQTNFNNMVRLSFANLFAPDSKVRFKEEFETALDIALQTPVQGYIAAQEGMIQRPDYFELLKSLNFKKSIVIGKKDTVVDGDTIIQLIKNTDIKYVELSEGHMSHIENKSELSYFIKHFIEK